MKSPIKIHGGKGAFNGKLAKQIVSLSPPHKIFLDAYCGSLSVLFNKSSENIIEYANDLNGNLTNFWKVLKDPDLFGAFQKIINLTPLSEVEFKYAKDNEGKTDLERAVLFFVRIRQSRQALGGSYCTPTKRLRRNMNENVSAWLNAVDGLSDAHNRLSAVEVWNRPAVEAIKKLDCKDFFTYLDPPYLHETRFSKKEYGEFEMSSENHEELLSCLEKMEGKFLLSGYINSIYEKFEKKNGWFKKEIEIVNNASSKKKKEGKIECLWANYQI